MPRDSHIGKYVLNCFGALRSRLSARGFAGEAPGRTERIASLPNYSRPVPGLSIGDHRFSSDDGAADPVAAAALAAFASGAGSEHAALTSLASVRLLVPVLAAPVQDSGPGVSRDKASEMSIPTLVGSDGRPAVPAFTCLDALVRWRPGARPVLVEAGRVWQSAAADSCAVVLDVAGPVPLAIDGARLAALARAAAVPLPHQDPDVLAEVTQIVAGQPTIDAVRLAAGGADGDLTIELTVSPGHPGPAADLARIIGAAVLARLGGRLRRGVQVAISPPPAG